MALVNLAKKIAQFVWDNGDWYEIMDTVSSLDELISETIIGLSDRISRKAIMETLTDIIDTTDDVEVHKTARQLCREVRGL